MRYFSFIISLLCITALCCNSSAQKEVKHSSTTSIPFYFGFNNDNFPSDSTSVKLWDPNDSMVFENKGYKPFFGSQLKGELKLTGKYRVEVIFYPDSLTKKSFQEFFEIDGSEKSIDLAVNLMHSFRGAGKEVYVIKYFDNKYNVQLKRLWNPQEQWSSKKELLPDYEWSNTYDSTVFGIYRQFSSSSMVSWVRNWNIAFMQFQYYNDTNWVNMNCNAPRIEAEIKKGQTGKTLKDMVNSCPAKEFKLNGKYRILLEYGINDAIYRTTKSKDKLDSSFYYEPHVYQLSDEFILK